MGWWVLWMAIGVFVAPEGRTGGLEAEIEAEARRQGVDVDLVVALARAECMGCGKVSRKGAAGPLQVMPGYWCPLGKAEGCDLVEAGVRALRTYLRLSAGDEELAVCRYNAGRRCDVVVERRGKRIVLGRDFAKGVMRRVRRRRKRG